MKKHMQPLKSKSDAELANDLQAAREKLKSLRFDKAHGKVKNFQEIRLTKKTIARMLTLLNNSAANK